MQNFPGGPVVKNVPADAGAMNSIPGTVRVRLLQGHD